MRYNDEKSFSSFRLVIRTHRRWVDCDHVPVNESENGIFVRCGRHRCVGLYGGHRNADYETPSVRQPGVTPARQASVGRPPATEAPGF
jgi:hypothetical protein